ncbi:MAG TPA: AsnC family transcriptional regulator [Pirellulales bacterium]|nr:AsnC family transcriptional regulator [Pirellulales bacterium]
MSTVTETSDTQLIELLRRRGAMSVTELADATDVTATAVRQRLTRLMGQGLVERAATRAGRGRPSHRYSLSAKARRQAGTNYADLAIMLWEQIRTVEDPEVRRGLLQRIAAALAGFYAKEVQGPTAVARMEALKRLFAERRVPLEIDDSGELPVLTVLDCPYPELAEKDRGICAVEKMLFAELLATPLRLSQCRLEGHTCCQFETN